jgi:mutator protein MutT
MEPIHVVAAVIRRRGRYLLARRPGHKRHGGLWEFPGGKLDAGEDHEAAARRELREELAMRCDSVGPVRWSMADPGSAYVIDFVDVEAAGLPQALEHSAVGWFTVVEMAALPLAPSDAAFVERLASPG